ncbi:DUF4012 domain-containing protein [Nocardioides houyundeii]|uniref:DUF4012 domain-containing protein n=1 Tax=Nocardioides houyundeii TaxID=2045452 RepID=UPI000C789C20|nr:DUF4012 domain-containing protein [Nocardioides houyundeii]
MTLRRALSAVAVLLIAVAAYAGWTAWQIKGDLEGAESSARELQDALSANSRDAAEAAASDLRRDSRSAEERSDGVVWSALTYFPTVGDDAEGVRAVSRSLSTLSEEAVPSLLDTADLLDQVSAGEGVDIKALNQLVSPVSGASIALSAAAEHVTGVSSDGFFGTLKDPYQEYVGLLTSAESAFAAAAPATELLPGMFGDSGERDYLLIFQNNAEIRATGGLPGAWAHVRTNEGRVALVEQGSGGTDFPELARPVLPLSAEEREVYDVQLGTYFLDANFTPHFPRAADLWRARFEKERDAELDGVIALDTVALSYLLKGTGPVTADGVTVNSENVVDELLHETYRELPDPAEQDARFQAMALAIFDAVTGKPRSAMDLAQGFGRAGREGRFLVHSFDPQEQSVLDGTAVAGELEDESTERPVVDVALNDVTGAKMSYYLRHDVEVRAESCQEGVQSLSAQMRIGSTISQDEVADLPPYISGAGIFGTEPGSQLVWLRIYGPVGGEITDVRFDGEPEDLETVLLNGRPVASMVTELSPTKNVDISWRMTTDEGQTGAGTVGVTPSIVSGNADTEFASAC